MSEVVVQGEMFKIKGDEPTPKEQLAIESVLAAKNKNKGVLNFDQQMDTIKHLLKPHYKEISKSKNP